MSVRISPNPIFVLQDESGDVVFGINNDGSPVENAVTVPTGLTQQMLKKTLTTAQLLALKATPIEIIPAPGAGKAIIVDQVNLHFIGGATGFTLNAGTFQLFVGAAANANPLFADVANGLITVAANRNILGIPTIKTTTDTDAHLINVNVVAANTGAAEFTLGNGALEIVVFYQIIAIP